MEICGVLSSAPDERYMHICAYIERHAQETNPLIYKCNGSAHWCEQCELQKVNEIYTLFRNLIRCLIKYLNQVSGQVLGFLAGGVSCACRRPHQPWEVGNLRTSLLRLFFRSGLQSIKKR